MIEYRVASFDERSALMEPQPHQVIGDPKHIVAQGYDQIAERLLIWGETTRADERARYTALLMERLAPGSSVLELGCGAGGPTTRALAERFALTGVDISAHTIELARAAIPSATFVQADMGSAQFTEASFDAVVAFYSIIHLPCEEHGALFRSVARWLRPGGLFVAALGATTNEEEYAEDWLGAPMYWSHHDGATNRRLVTEAGLRLVSAQDEVADEDGAPITFLWVVAQKPAEE